MFPALDTFLYVCVLHTAPFSPLPSNSPKWRVGLSSNGSEQSDLVLSMYHQWSDKKSAGKEEWQKRLSFFFNEQRSLVISARVSFRVGGRILLYGSNCVFFTCGCKGHRIERIQKYSTSYIKKLTARVCFSQASCKVSVLGKKSSQMV